MHLSDILATEQLSQRPAHPLRAAPAPAVAAERDQGDTVVPFRARAAQAMALCGAQSAGVSLFDPDGNDELTWIATTGALARFEGQRLVRHSSMCGICFEYRDVQLFIAPHRYFTWMRDLGILAGEALVAPLLGPTGALYGTIWVMAHDDPDIHFNRQDANLLSELGKGMYNRVRVLEAARREAAGKPPPTSI